MSAAEAPMPASVMDVFTTSYGDARDEHITRPSHPVVPSSSSSSSSSSSPMSGPKTKLMGIPRWTLGILLLMITVVMWTSSNFLASYIFADNTYSKPYFVTFANTTVFALSLVPMLIKRLQDGRGLGRRERVSLWSRFRAIWDDRGKRRADGGGAKIFGDGDEADLHSLLIGNNDDDDDDDDMQPRSQLADSQQLLLVVDDATHSSHSIGRNPPPRIASSSKDNHHDHDPLSFREIVKLSIEFSSLWFAANYSAAACLEFTTVASATILTSTSSIWTLLFGSLMGVETFTVKKLLGVLASVAGIILISSVDLSGSTDRHRGSFPHKTTKQLALGDILALLSAIIYGFYTVLMKKRIGDESRVDVLLFFGLVGLSNLVLLWPGFVLLHFTGVERFEMPPSGKVWVVIITNSLTSFLSDLCWAFAMLLTSPLVVTVGLGLNIPLSLIGQIILKSQYASFGYWVGAGVVLMSFLFINHEVESASDDEHVNKRNGVGIGMGMGMGDRWFRKMMEMGRKWSSSSSWFSSWFMRRGSREELSFETGIEVERQEEDEEEEEERRTNLR